MDGHRSGDEPVELAAGGGEAYRRSAKVGDWRWCL